MSLSIELSTKNFAEASKIEGYDEFCFIIGKKEVKCHKFVASFLSHPISQNLLSDPTFNSVSIKSLENIQKSNANEIEENVKKTLEHLVLGETVDITEEELKAFNADLQEIRKGRKLTDIRNTTITALLILNDVLRNDEITNKIINLFMSHVRNKSDENNEKIEKKIEELQNFLTFINLIEQEETKNKFNKYEQFFENGYQNMIDQIASHFYEIEEKSINELEESILEAILSSKKLKVKSEDSLLQTLLNRRSYILSKEAEYEGENEHEFFIEKVRFEYLSTESIERFLNEFEFRFVNENIWKSVTKRLLLQVESEASDRQKSISNRFAYDSKNPLNGIFKHLTSASNGNICTNKTIEIKCHEFCCGKIESLVDFNNSKGYTHVDGSYPMWIQFDLKTRKIQLDSYLIKSTNNSNYGDVYALKSWRVEVSDDENEWIMIDKRENNSDLNGEDKMQVFNISSKHKPFRFIRIITNEKSWASGTGVAVARIELFGKIIETK